MKTGEPNLSMKLHHIPKVRLAKERTGRKERQRERVSLTTFLILSHNIQQIHTQACANTHDIQHTDLETKETKVTTNPYCSKTAHYKKKKKKAAKLHHQQVKQVQENKYIQNVNALHKTALQQGNWLRILKNIENPQWGFHQTRQECQQLATSC